jgi:hypothetical protein
MPLNGTGPVHEATGPTQNGANWHVPEHALVLDASTTHSPETAGPVYTWSVV